MKQGNKGTMRYGSKGNLEFIGLASRLFSHWMIICVIFLSLGACQVADNGSEETITLSHTKTAPLLPHQSVTPSPSSTLPFTSTTNIITQSLSLNDADVLIKTYFGDSQATVDAEGRVTALRLSSQITKLPPEITLLTDLKELDLSNASSLDKLPPEIWQLTNLNMLNLRFMQIDSLPPEIGQLVNLVELDLQGTSLTTLPSEIGHLKNLRRLDLQSSDLEYLPPEIGELRQLTELDVQSTQLAFLPDTIGQLDNLQDLYLSYTLITALPPQIEQLKNLALFEWWGMSLPELPLVLTRLPNLKALNFSASNLTALPPEIRHLTNLTTLKIVNTKITSLPPEIGQLSNLRTLHLRLNNLTQLPAEIGQLSNLESLEVIDTSLINLPPEIGQLHNLQKLNLFSNNLSNLPSEIGQLSQLRSLNLAQNNLSHLAPEIGQLSQLTELKLFDNHFSHLPPEIDYLPHWRDIINIEHYHQFFRVLNANFNNQFRLLGYDLPHKQATPGESFEIILFWQALKPVNKSYKLFTHLLDDTQKQYGGGDWYMGGQFELFPTFFHPGSIYKVEYPVFVYPQSPGGIYWVDIGLYPEDDANNTPLPLRDDNGVLAQNSILLGPIRVGGQPPASITQVPPQHQREVLFGDTIGLVGYSLLIDGKSVESVLINGESVKSVLINGESVKPTLTKGESAKPALTLDLYWASLNPMATDYTLFIHLIDSMGNLVAQQDGPPVGGLYPTSVWAVGEQIFDHHEINLDNLTAGDYEIRVGWYNSITGERLPISSRADNAIILDTIVLP